MYGARVFNRVDKVPIESRALGWRIGMPTMILALVLALGVLALLQFSTTIAIVAALVSLVLIGLVIVLTNTADPDKVLSETTVIRLLLTGLWTRQHRNY